MAHRLKHLEEHALNGVPEDGTALHTHDCDVVDQPVAKLVSYDDARVLSSTAINPNKRKATRER